MWYYILAIILVLIVGLLVIVRDVMTNYKNGVFIQEFREKFHSFIHNIENNDGTYEWLTMNIVKMQNLSGDLGMLEHFQPPYANYILRRVQIFTNFLPMIREEYMRMKTMYFSNQETLRFYTVTIDDALLRLIGVREGVRISKIKDAKNPLVWLREGVRCIITLPISILYWTGLIQYRWYTGILESHIVKFLSGLVGLIGFVSSIVTIITGYNPLIAIFKEWGWMRK